MIETLYRTKNPQPTAWRQQFFELSLGEQTVDGQRGYFVRETQCWSDGTATGTLRVQYTLSPREGFATLEEAQSRYQLRRMSRAQAGFVHSYTPRYDSKRKNNYVLIEIAPETVTLETSTEEAEVSPNA